MRENIGVNPRTSNNSFNYERLILAEWVISKRVDDKNGRLNNIFYEKLGGKQYNGIIFFLNVYS